MRLTRNETRRLRVPNLTCTWVRQFDNNFNLSCANETHERGNGNFKGKDRGAKWEFIFCPYCGGKINEIFPESDEDNKQ